jgi:hypothetical protein
MRDAEAAWSVKIRPRKPISPTALLSLAPGAQMTRKVTAIVAKKIRSWRQLKSKALCSSTVMHPA